MKHSAAQSECPINFTLEMLNNRWALLIIRDIVFYGKHTYGEFLSSKEGITTSMLADQLSSLEREGIIIKKRSQTDRRKEVYSLTEKGYDLIPILIELGNWGLAHSQRPVNNPAWVQEVKVNRNNLISLIRDTLQEGGSVMAGPNSVLNKLGIPATF